MKVRIICFLVIAFTLYRCANQITPTGGPRDKRPPVLLESKPTNNEKNVKLKSIELTFDEYVKLNNPKEEIMISPSPGKDVDIVNKGPKVTITPKEKWRDSTTYSIAFREGIKDITEGNVPVNLKLAFSTGPYIDSLRVTGNVEEILKGLRAEKITVALYSSDTFDIFTDIPDYFTKTNKRGQFSIENIRAGEYGIYAFDDKNKNLKVESRAERYGFLSTKLDLKKNIDSLRLGIFMLDSRQPKISAIRNAGPVTRIRFNKYISEYTLRGDLEVTSAFGDNQTEITIWNPPLENDSIQVYLSATDSLESVTDSVFYIKKTDVKFVKENFKWGLGDPSVDSETGILQTTIRFNKPIINIDFDSIFIKLDTINKVPITKEDIIIDPVKKEVRLKKLLDKKLFQTKKEPELLLTGRKGLFYSIDSDTSKASEVKIKNLWPESTGILLTEIQTKQKNFILQLLDNDQPVQSLKNVNKHTFKTLEPKEFKLRAIVDLNNNGRWDPGNFVKNQEPEPVYFYKSTDGKQGIPIRANWELGPLTIKF